MLNKMQEIPIEYYDLDSFTSDDIFLKSISKLESNTLVEYVRVIERMMFLWSCELNIHFYELMYYSINELHHLPSKYRIEMGKNMIEFQDTPEKVKRFVSFTTIWMETNVSLSEINTFMTMYASLFCGIFQEYNNDITDSLYRIITDEKLQEEYQYFYILRCENMIPIQTFSILLWRYFHELNLSIHTRILVCQYILNHSQKLRDIDLQVVFSFLMSVLENNVEEYPIYIQTDVADMILNIHNSIPDDLRKKAIDIIIEAGGNHFSMYHNQENIHNIQESSITPILKILQQKYGHFKRELENDISIVKEKSRGQKEIEISLLRIQLDSQYYNNLKIRNIFQLVISYILSHPDIEQELWKRCLEELQEMSGKCSTGYAVRLLNILSGFDEELSVTIPEDERFKSIFFHKLNKHLSDNEDGDNQSNILYELTIDSSKPELRQNFLKFFRKVFPILSNEMYQEFKDNLDDTTIDLYLRKAYYDYESSY